MSECVFSKSCPLPLRFKPLLDVSEFCTWGRTPLDAVSELPSAASAPSSLCSPSSLPSPPAVGPALHPDRSPGGSAGSPDPRSHSSFHLMVRSLMLLSFSPARSAFQRDSCGRVLPRCSVRLRSGQSVVRHIGGAEGGHYIAYRRVPEHYDGRSLRKARGSDVSLDSVSIGASSADSSPHPGREYG